MADVRDERIIAQLAAITQRTRHRVYEPLESLARERRDFDRFANRFAIDLPRGGKIRLVRGDDAGARRLRGDERAIVVRQPTRAIEDDNCQIGIRCGATGSSNPFLLDDVNRIAQSGRIDETDRQPANVGALRQQIAGGSGNCRHDGAVRVEKRVEETRLANVGRSQNRHVRAFSYQSTAACSHQQRRNIVCQLAHLVSRRWWLNEVITLFWKIERGFEARHQVEQPLLDRTNPRGECPLQLIKRRASLQRCDWLDEIAYRLRLNQIELAIERLLQGDPISRRAFLRRTGRGGVALGAAFSIPALLAACASPGASGSGGGGQATL